MGLWVPSGAGDFTWSVANTDAQRPANSTWGTTCAISGAANTKGSYTQLLSATAFDAMGIYVSFTNAAISGTNEDALVDIGVDPAGGSSYTVLLPNLIASCCCPYNSGGAQIYYFPVAIKAGSTVAVRMQDATGSNDCQTVVRLVGKPRDPSKVWCGTIVDSFGIDTANSRGTVLTPGTTSDGTFAAIASGIAHDYAWWQLGMGIGDTTMTSGNMYACDLAFGSSTSLNSLIIQDQLFTIPTANETLFSHGRVAGCGRRVPTGSNLYGRIQCSGTADSGVSMAAWGVR